MKIVEAGASDAPRLAAFFLETPIGAGTEFILDRSPDFNALLRLRGEFRTFYACERGCVVGVATALWEERRDGDDVIRVGEFVDLRVAASSRGGPAAHRLLTAVLQAFEDAGVGWICALIADSNDSARRLIEGKAGLPRIIPLTRFVSVHMMAARPPWRARSLVTIREATDDDADLIHDTVGRIRRPQRLAPLTPFTWPDASGRHRGWLATSATGEVIGGLVLWDGFDVRRTRIVRYAGSDRMLRCVTRVIAPLHLTVALPRPGEALRMWASRVLWNDAGAAAVTRALVTAARHAAAACGAHVVQLNLSENDPLMEQLPRYPRSTFGTTLYGARWDGGRPGIEGAPLAGFFADLALV